MKHLAMHGIHLKAERCTVFNCLHDPMPSTSAVGTRPARPGRSVRGLHDVTHYDWLYIGKCTDAVCVRFVGENKYDNISAKELLIPRIPTQYLFCVISTVTVT